MQKQAILIMYHTDYELLLSKIKLLDYKNIDIFIHVDKKVKKFNYDLIKNNCQKSNIYFTKQMDVRWSTYSQIKCELLLLNEAMQKGKYQYYHLLSGVDMPIKKVDYIYHFFQKHYPKEFIAYENFDNINQSYQERIKYYHIFNDNLRSENKVIRKISDKLYYNTLKIERMLKINRLKNTELAIRKGANWFSITDKCAEYIVANTKLIKKMFSHSYCADELFIQTLIYNSSFRENIYRKFRDEHQNIYRLIDWHRGSPYTFRACDYQLIKKSSSFFARKFSTSLDNKIIKKITKDLSEEKNEN